MCLIQSIIQCEVCSAKGTSQTVSASRKKEDISSVCSVQCAVCIEQCPVSSMHCAVWALYSIQCVLSSVQHTTGLSLPVGKIRTSNQCAVCSVQCSLGSVQCALCSIQCLLFSVRPL